MLRFRGFAKSYNSKNMAEEENTIDKTTNTVEIGLKLIPVYTLTILVVEACRQYYYYANFHFNITSYLAVTNLLNSILGEVVRVIFSIITGGVLTMFIFNVFDTIYSNKLSERFLTEEQKLKFRKRKKFGKNILAIVFGILILAGFFMTAIKFKAYFFTYSFVVCNTFIFFIIENKYEQHIKDKFSKAVFIYILLTGSMINMYSAFAFIPAHMLKTRIKLRNIGIQLITDTSNNPDSISYPAFKSKYYIGNTPEFYFIYNETDSLTEVIRASDVKKVISYKNNLLGVEFKD